MTAGFDAAGFDAGGFYTIETEIMPVTSARSLFLAFNPPAGVMPIDVARDWTVDDGGDAVAVRDLELATGAGWSFESAPTVLATPGATSVGAEIQGDITIAMGAAFDLAAIGGAVAVALLSQTPDGGGLVLWQLGLIVIDVDRALVRLFLRWESSAGIWTNLDGPTFVLPAGSVTIFASRERTAAGYVGRFGVNGQMGGTTPAVDLTIGDVPAAPNPISIWTATGNLSGCRGVLEWVDVQARAASLEEFELVGRRFAELTPKVESAMRRYTGGAMRDVWSTDPGSLVQREFRVEAGILGYARAECEVIGRYTGPLTSWGEVLESWEAITALPRRAGDGFDERRERIRLHLALDGNSLDEIREALADPFGLDAASVVLEEAADVVFRDDFDARVDDGDGYYASGHDEEAWIQGNPSAWTFALTGGVERISRTLAADDLRWLGRMVQGDAHPPYYLHATGEGGVDTVFQTRLTAFTTPADNILAGLVIGDLEADDWTWIGLVKVGGGGGAWEVRWARHVGEDPAAVFADRHAGPSAWSGGIALVGAAFAATSIRVRQTETPGAWEIQAVTGADPADWTIVTPTLITGATPRPRWGGLAIVGLGSSVTGACSVDWTYYEERSPAAPWKLTWHAFRDPALGGTYDLAAAQGVLDTTAPAHTEATALDRHRSLVYEDATTLLDRDPVGT